MDSKFTLNYFKYICKGSAGIKNLLINQKKIAGIGNAYVHDILFRAKIHPKTPVNTPNNSQIDKLFEIIIENLQKSLDTVD